MAIPIHFISVEHGRLEQKHGMIKGVRISEVCGRVSAYMLFASLIGLWFSPQPRFTIPILSRVSLAVPGVRFAIPAVHFVLFVPFLFFGLILLSRSVSDLTRKVSEAHHPERVVTTGIYARVRHPQYLGFLLMHVGFSVLMSGTYSLIATLLIFMMLYAFARKEEVELMREFGGDEYDAYRRTVPMLIPRLRGQPKT
ncbi:MAG: methyltransferase family protein [Spirochaetia bacterium]